MRITYTISKTNLAAQNDTEFALYAAAIRDALQAEFPMDEIEIIEAETLNHVHVIGGSDEIAGRVEQIATRAIEQV